MLLLILHVLVFIAIQDDKETFSSVMISFIVMFYTLGFYLRVEIKPLNLEHEFS